MALLITFLVTNLSIDQSKQHLTPALDIQYMVSILVLHRSRVPPTQRRPKQGLEPYCQWSSHQNVGLMAWQTEYALTPNH